MLSLLQVGESYNFNCTQAPWYMTRRKLQERVSSYSECWEPYLPNDFAKLVTNTHTQIWDCQPILHKWVVLIPLWYIHRVVYNHNKLLGVLINHISGLLPSHVPGPHAPCEVGSGHETPP